MRCSLSCLLVLLQTGVVFAADDEAAVTARVNARIEAGWKHAGVAPADRASDAEFVRRAYLDLTGVIPTVQEARDFLDDKRKNKRARLIDRLIGAPADAKPQAAARFATRLADIWQHAMLPQLNNSRRYRNQAGVFHTWLRNHFAENTPYDKMVGELLTYTGSASGYMIQRGRQRRITGPGLYYQLLELKPEELAASTSRLFLGVQIQCAQCHNHPFDHWTQKDFWSYAAFFAQLKQPAARGNLRFVREVADTNTGEVKLPDTETVVAPRFLGSKSTELTTGKTRRQQLAVWLTSKENPYFAKATVNRVWAILFGYGLVDPVDDFGKHNAASHPQLLNELAADFANNGYDLRRLFRILAKSRAYQLSSELKKGEAEYARLFNRMAIKSLTPEQIYDCVEIATAKRDLPNAYQSAGYGSRPSATKQQFIGKFEAPTQGTTEFQAGIPQALTMMNGSLIAAATDVNRSDILIAVTEAPFMTDEQRVESLFLAALSRKPTDAERAKFVGYIKRKGARQAYGDVLWALLNSTEFLLNH